MLTAKSYNGNSRLTSIGDNVALIILGGREFSIKDECGSLYLSAPVLSSEIYRCNHYSHSVHTSIIK